ncbi:MAG: hypothetical protein LBH93_04915 [Chitinispirillales bacterium]|jgi:uncharacterized protein (TIGR02145 family)|nr:hypothetical protein [Chitinispirillales bacterium]
MKKTLEFFSVVLLAWLVFCAAPQKGGRLAGSDADIQIIEAAEEQAWQVAGNQPQNGGEAGLEHVADAGGQGPLPKIAVHVTGGKTPGENKALGARIAYALINSGRYDMIERSGVFSDRAAQEAVKQGGGAVGDEQINRLGRQAGADFVCIGEILEVFGAHQISVRIMNVESVEVLASGLASGSLKTAVDFAALADRVVAILLGAAQNAGAAAEPDAAHDAMPQAQPVGSVKTPDGGNYLYVKIGDLMWMAENLNTATEGSWCYGDRDSNCVKYGRLYTWDAAMAACPKGWHLPNGSEWDNLIDAAGGDGFAGKKLKSTGGWGKKGNGTDNFGFSALPGGLRDDDGGFNAAGYIGYWWNASNARFRSILYTVDNVFDNYYDKGYGLSVRCVQDRSGKK